MREHSNWAYRGVSGFFIARWLTGPTKCTEAGLIPEWNAEGVLPPINEDDPTGFDRAPYEVSLGQVVDRFATSPERCDILAGYLAH